MKGVIIPILFAVLLLVPLVYQNAFACGSHGTMSGNDILDWIVTPLSGADQFELRFKNFNTFAYTTGELCSCALQIASTWNIPSAQLVFEGTNTPVPTFPTFTFDSVISPNIQGDLNSISAPPSGFQWLVLKNTIATTDAGGHDVDLVFTGTFPGKTQSEIVRELQGKQVAVGKIEEISGTTDYQYEPDHVQILNIVFPIVGGELIPIDSTSLLLAGSQITAAWLIPAIVSGIGIAIVIAKKY